MKTILFYRIAIILERKSKLHGRVNLNCLSAMNDVELMSDVGLMSDVELMSKDLMLFDDIDIKAMSWTYLPPFPFS